MQGELENEQSMELSSKSLIVSAIFFTKLLPNSVREGNQLLWEVLDLLRNKFGLICPANRFQIKNECFPIQSMIPYRLWKNQSSKIKE